MEKQHNRGQEGAGVACVKQNMNPGEEFMFRERAEGANAITEVFAQIHSNYEKLTDLQLNDPLFAANTLPFAGNSYIGHLRYSTTGRSGISYVHPFMRRSNWKSKNLAVCGNFNFTNVDEVFEMMYQSGQHPRRYADTFILLEQLGHRLDREVERVYQSINKKNKNGQEINEEIETNIKIIKTTFLYKIDDYAILDNLNFYKMIIYKDNIYLELKNPSNIEIGKIIENSKIIYDNNKEKIIKRGKIVKTEVITCKQLP